MSEKYKTALLKKRQEVAEREANEKLGALVRRLGEIDPDRRMSLCTYPWKGKRSWSVVNNHGHWMTPIDGYDTPEEALTAALKPATT